MSGQGFSFLLVFALCAALFCLLAPTVGIAGALAGIGVCFVGALLGGGPFILYAIWGDRRR